MTAAGAFFGSRPPGGIERTLSPAKERERTDSGRKHTAEEFENGEGRRDAGNISGERQGVAELWMEYRKK